MAKLTFKEVKADLGKRDITITKRDGEYRVNLKGGTEATASYTTDLQDARDTGFAMARHRDERANDENGACRHCGRDNRGHEDEACSDDCPRYDEAA